jgi:tetratricopeptide (TPR) repeat protein
MGGFLWPFAAYSHPRVSSTFPVLPYGAQYGDSFLNGMIEKEASAQQAIDEYLSLDIAQAGRADRRFELAMELQQRIDARCGWDTGEFIERNLSREHLFMSHGHPNYPLLRYLIDGVCRRIGVESAQIDHVLDHISAYPCTGSEIPIHPSICKHFGLSFIQPGHRYRYFRTGQLTFEEFAQAYMDREWSDAFDKAAALQRDGNLDDAVRAALAGTREAPGSSIGWHFLGTLLAASGKLDESIMALRRATEIDPHDPKPQRDLAAVLLRDGVEHEAEAAYLRAIELAPDDATAWMGLAGTRVQWARFRDAIAAAEQAWIVNGWLPSGQRAFDECRRASRPLNVS